MRVLYLTTEWPNEAVPNNGIFVREFAHAAATVADIAVVAIDRSRGGKGLFDVTRLPDERLPVWRVRYRSFPRPLSYLAYVLGTMSALRRAKAAGFTPDVVHTHSFRATLLAALLVHKPIVYTEQWSIFLPDNPNELPPALQRAARIAFRRAQIILPPSDAMRRALQELAPRAAFRVIPNVVDHEAFPLKEGAPSADPSELLCAGMMTENGSKGIDYLLEAAALLAGRGRRFELHLAGDGPRRAEYEALAQSLGIAERVHFHGLIPKAELSALMRRADLFVLASRFDNNPCVIIEAMASGLPVVATRVGGVPEMVTEGTGLLVEPHDPQALADGIDQALERLDEFDAAAISEYAATRYGSSAVAAELRGVYADASRRG
jgi:glycosyltransferase involved in cell wall biosynthesis